MFVYMNDDDGRLYKFSRKIFKKGNVFFRPQIENNEHY